MEINKAISNQNVIITLKGRLDTMTAPQLDDEAKSIDFDGVETVTLNLKDLEYISSSGLRVILALYKNLKSNTIMELFSMTGMSDYLDIKQG